MGQLTYPDYGVYQSQVISPEGDLGEIAAKITHPRYRREGRILSFADCSPSMDGWMLDTSCSIEYNTFQYEGTGAVSGNASVLCQDSPPNVASVVKFLPTTLNRRMGLEFMIAFNNTNSRIIMETTYWLNLTAKIGRITFNSANGDVSYQDDTGYHLFTTHPGLTYVRNWINVKLVTDYDTSKYIRFYIDNDEYIINQVLRNEATFGEYGSFFGIYGYSWDGILELNYNLDNLLITTNER